MVKRGACTLGDMGGQGQGSEKLGRWGRVFPDSAKSHGQFGPKTTYKTDGQTERQRDRQTDSQIQTDRRLTERHMDKQLDGQTDIQACVLIYR